MVKGVLYSNMFEKEKEQFIKLRKNIPVNTSINEFKDIYGKAYKAEILKFGLVKNRGKESVVKDKLRLIYKYRDVFFFSDWVRYIGVTGSIAAGSAKECDDLDIFIVVRNYRMWIYRGIILLKMIRKSRRAKNEYQKDLFCLNMIIEERGIDFPEDIFNFHELMMMRTVFNTGYKDYILQRNTWVKKFGYVSDHVSVSGYKPVIIVSVWLKIVNWFAYISQIIYMIILNHKPDIKRIVKDNKEGKILFYRKDFKEEKLNLLNNI